MERVREEVAVDDIAAEAEFTGKGCDFPGHNILGSPVMRASVASDWAESSTNEFMDKGRIEANNSNRHASSLAGSEPCHSMPWPTKDTGNVMKELTVGNYRTPHLALVSSQENHKQAKWQRIYRSPSDFRFRASHVANVSEDKDKLLSKAGERLTRTTSNWLNLKPLSTKRIDQDTKETSIFTKGSDKVVISSNTLPNGDAAFKTLATPSFSQTLVKKAKGKEVPLKKEENVTEFGDSVAGHINGIPVYARKVASSALVNSTAKDDQLSSGSDYRSAPEPPLHYGISLREWLKPEHSRRVKVESLQIFRHIVELVESAHSQGLVFENFRPSYFNLEPSNRIVYTGSFTKRETEAAILCDSVQKRPIEDGDASHRLAFKQQKLSADNKFGRHHSYVTGPQNSGYAELQSQSHRNYQIPSSNTRQESISLTLQLENKWYRSPEQLVENCCSASSNIYSLGILLFELLSSFESFEMHSAVMLDLRDRILPPRFLSENPREAGFCLWLLHPEPSSRPTAREILQSALISECRALDSGGNESKSLEDDDAISELSLQFLYSFEEQKRKQASKLVEAINCLEEDIKEVEKRHSLKASEVSLQTKQNLSDAREEDLELGISSVAISSSNSVSSLKEVRFLRNIKQIEEAYFSTRSQIQNSSSAVRSDKDFLKDRTRWREVHNENENSNKNHRAVDSRGDFFEGLCKFARYNKFEECGSLRNGDLVSNTNVLCSLSFDRDEDYIATAGVSRKIKVFEFDPLLNDSMGIHYPVVEMPNKSKLSSVCWNNYIKNYLASADYDGVVQIWDASTGQGFSQYTEHQKRAWSVDFSVVDPLMFVSGSDDCSVKLWSINERNSLGTIGNPANVCCVQFSASSTHLLAFGSADYKVYCYDLRHTRIPWCTLAGHGKAVSYVKFLDSETLVSASTDNTLKLWDLNKTSSTGLSSSACSLTLGGHTNEKNFVGLSAHDGYIACGSETNEVYCYYRSLPMPITSYKFGCVDPISGNEISDDSGQFVSSVCWRRKSNMVVAANSGGNIKVLRMV